MKALVLELGNCDEIFGNENEEVTKKAVLRLQAQIDKCDFDVLILPALYRSFDSITNYKQGKPYYPNSIKCLNIDTLL